ncbi:hypothetical protein PZB74_12165 [Porifericola rhodea]|uniref:hypothetical protein n=1 Tax=Porifericola rhodea TaxID=930972 RepID=UPI002666E4A6|nr:hypothetical protein [Porifericola rhodea]WKN29722.1 hypothetical protein PZB74_12165 [Porifericola rhodea]
MKALAFFTSIIACCVLTQANAQDKNSLILPKLELPEFSQDTLYSFTPSWDGKNGYHLRVWKPSIESIMPTKDYQQYREDEDILLNPLLPSKPYQPKDKMPNMIDPELQLRLKKKN